MRVFITGITGTLGTEVTRLLLMNYPEIEIIGYSREELKQAQFEFVNDKRVTLVLGDVFKRYRIVEQSRHCDMIFHFAATKRIDSIEANPEESIDTNIEGTRNVLSAQRANKIKRVVFSSTDKAMYPVNVYGACKLVAERLVLRNSNNVVCRYGNVFGSRGSVVQTFINSIKNKKPVPITNIEMTRFFIKIEDAAKFVIESAFSNKGGLYIPKMKACFITDLIEAICLELYLPVSAYERIGLRAGEKIHEDLTEDQSSKNEHCHFTIDELREIVRTYLEN